LRPIFGELVVLGGQRRIELDGRAVGRRDRDDDEPCVGPANVGCDCHACTVPVDATHRCVQHDTFAEFGGRRLGDLLGAARETVLLGTVLDVEQPVQAAGGVRVAGGVQHRHVVGFTPHVTWAMMASRSRDESVARTERNHSPSDRPSSSRARRASQGVATGMLRAILSNCQRNRPMSSSPVSESLGMVPR
jgi:hypothetical protein